ncbi:ProQ/FINO family protein [uncultured Vibrio sp.]|uniref:ProQ/FINO family protein n=1 Tax=uncultured Vibrio sp. TaxID=114054 RepID=UPI00262BF179|nr:ProQ/FINO family protein [uncultured Vibrio sp.]
MTQRPILKLKNETKEIVQPVKKAEKEPLNQKKLQEKARLERIKRHRQAFKILLALDLTVPLAKGVGKDLITLLQKQGASYKPARSAIHKLVQSDAYLNAVIEGEYRFNLDGTQAEMIEEIEKEYSRSIMAERQKKKA